MAAGSTSTFKPTAPRQASPIKPKSSEKPQKEAPKPQKTAFIKPKEINPNSTK